MTCLEDALRDVRLAARTLARDRAFTAAAIGVLAFGVGLAVAMFSVSDTVLRRPMPVRDEQSLVVLWGESPGSMRRLPLRPERFAQFRRHARTLTVAGVVSAEGWPHAIRDGARTLSLGLAPVTGNFFEVLGSSPALGRTLRDSDDVVGAEPVAMISYRVWRRYFGGDRGIIGRRLTLHQLQRTFTVVGVMPRGLDFPAGADVWIPLATFDAPEVVPLGRLQPGATPAQAAAELQAAFARAGTAETRHVRGVAMPLRDVVVGNLRPVLLLLSAGAALLLIVACVNVANLMLVRASGRAQEIAVRRALGAGRGRIVRQLLTESALVGGAGGLAGTGLAVALLHVLIALAPAELPRLDEIRLAGIPAGIAVWVTVASALIFGLAPVWWTPPDGLPLVRAASRLATETRAARRGRHALVVVQMGLAVVVLSAAGLLARSLQALERAHMGFAPDHVAVAQLAWPPEEFDGPGKVTALYDRLIPRLEALPNVSSAAPVNVLPFAGGWDGWFVPEGQAAGAAHPLFNLAAVGPAYFQTLGVPVLRGRGFGEADREGSVPVAVVSESVSRTLWPGQDPVGKRIAMGEARGPDDWWTVVGLVGETRYRALRDPAPTVYLPYRQFRGAITLVNTVAIRTTGDPVAALRSIRGAVHETDPDVLVMSAETMDRLVASQLAQPRLSAVLLSVFGAGALVLAAVGLYAVLAYVVRQRARELAIRSALGAPPRRLRSLVLMQGLVMAGSGIVLGLSIALAAGRLLHSILFEVRPGDPVTLGAATLVLLVVALAASYLPAQRATKADVASVLKAE